MNGYRHAFFTIPFLLATLLFAASTHFALAQESSGIGIAPASIEDRAEPGELFIEELKVTNLSERDQEYFVYSRDIEGVRNGGVPVFADEGIETTGFEMSTWITLPEEQPFLVGAGESITVPVRIQVPEDATPGSHFAGLFASIEPPRLRSTGASVGYGVVSVVSLLIAGDTVESVNIREFSTESTVYSQTDVDFELRIENKGNVLARPYGPLEITNMFGKRVELLTANEQLDGVFPGTIRDFVINWSSDEVGFGKYTATLGLIYGSGEDKRSITAETSFWVLPLDIIGPAAIALIVLLGAVYFGVRMYVRSVVRNLSGGRVVQRRSSKSRSSGSPAVLVTFVFLVVTVLFLLILLVLFA